MKKLTLTCAAVLTGAAIFHTTAAAQAATNATLGDLILGFQTTAPATGNATNLEVDLGNASIFQAAAAADDGQTITLTSDLSISDLNSTYDNPTTGAAPTSLFFGVNGTTAVSTTNEVFISSDTAVGPNNTAGTAGNSIRNTLSTVYGAYDGGVTGAAGSTDTLVSSSVTGSLSNVAGAPPGTYKNTFPFGTEDLYTTTGTPDTLTLFDEKKGTGAAEELGTLTLTSNGSSETLVFTGVGEAGGTGPITVPEPSTYALFGVSALALFFALRRRGMLQS